MVKINKITRDAGIKFFAGDIFGFFGYCFLDLVKHEYVEEVKVSLNFEVTFATFAKLQGKER